tara:strand:- start:8599 stop:9918 length:1320 start_codon:yes stop_codon:yes gene_type:complete
MITLKKYQNKIVGIYGLGKTGISAAKTLKKLKAKILCWDDNETARKKAKNLNFKLGKFWTKSNSIDFIVISPGINIDKCKIKNFLRNNSKKIITDLDLFFEINRDSLIISITGTNGKSTTCKLIEKIFKTAGYNAITAGNIGNPILNLKINKKKILIILEVSSYQLQYSKIFKSKHAAILNIFPDHLERHKSMLNYTKIKSKIFYGQDINDYSYLNSNNNYSKNIKKIFKFKKLKSKLILVNENSYKHLLKNLKNSYFKSKGNKENLAFAYKISKNFNIKDQTILKALNSFKGLPHRQELIFSKNKFNCVNDSKATSFNASLQSLMNYKKIYWILGGLPKYQDKFDLKKVSNKIVRAYVVGKTINFFIKKIKKNLSYKKSYNIKNAINDILIDIKKNKDTKFTILLSPAAASYDQFQNFEERGNYFKNIIISKLKKLNV